MIRRRAFYQRESRMFCPCELCRLRFGRMLYLARDSSEPLGYRRLPGFAGNFSPAWVRMRQQHWRSYPMRRRRRTA
jgi:hypothetical protein